MMLLTNKSEKLKGTQVFCSFCSQFLTKGEKNVFASQRHMVNEGNFWKSSRLPNIKHKSMKYSKDQSLSYSKEKRSYIKNKNYVFIRTSLLCFLQSYFRMVKCLFYLCWIHTKALLNGLSKALNATIHCLCLYPTEKEAMQNYETDWIKHSYFYTYQIQVPELVEKFDGKDKN